MKLLHTADWHLGKRLEQFSRLEEQKEVLEEICQIADEEEVDAVLVAGDLFDMPNPSVEAIETLYKYLKKLSNDGKRAVVGIAGNHDSPDRIEAPNPLARECGIILTGYPQTEIRPFEIKNGIKVLRADKGFVELQLPSHSFPLRLILTPYANEVRLRKFLGNENTDAELRQLLQEHWNQLASQYVDDEGVNILMAHLFVTTSEVPEEEWEDPEEKSILTLGGAQAIFPSNFPNGLQYVALGHIHSYIKIKEQPYPIAYSSSPLCYSVSDKQKQKNVLIIDVEPKKEASIKKIPLTKGKPTIQQRCEGMEEALKWLNENPDFLVELTLVTDQHLSASERKQLLDSHEGLIRIIPEFTDPELLRFTSGKNIDLGKSIESLFEDYFQYKKNQPINEELKDLFKEILNEVPNQ